jgi:adenylate cyclase
MLRFHITNKLGRQSHEHPSGPVEFGRGPDAQKKEAIRFVIQDGYVSKDHVRIEEQPESQLRVENLSARNSIRLSDNSIIDKGETRTLKAPVRLTVGETFLDVEVVADPSSGPLETIASPVRRDRGSVVADAARIAAVKFTIPESQIDWYKAPPIEKLMQWFETFVAVQHAAAGSPEFYAQTSEAVVKLVGLDRGLVILRSPKQGPNVSPSQRWMVQARYPDDGSSIGREFSLTILERVMKDRRTFFQSSAAPATTSESLQGVEAVVASPIFDPQDNVVGFVYGCRTRFNPQRGIGVGPLEAQVMQVLASSVATGLARQQHEAEASRTRVQFEQFVSAELAQELQKNPTLLTGQEREITVLFSDIRSFSKLSERVGPKLTCELVSDIMDRQSECIRQCEGTVVDFAGDGIMAMWNAPIDQPDHAVKACRAALAMQAALPQIDADWHARIGQGVKIGIGLNTGLAMCGNTGSRTRFKYGPLGHTVNLASRVEGATKQLGVPILITGSTRAKLGDGFATRRLCKVRVVGILGAVDLCELYAEAASPEWVQRRDTYEMALEKFEGGEFGTACRSIYPLLAHEEGNYDMPCLNLITRAVEAIKNPPASFDGVLELVNK